MSENKSILVIEDERHTRRLITYNLNRLGYRIFEAGNGKEAIAVCEKIRPDLILCDVMMPIMDGLEFRETILKNRSLHTIPFIFLTARAQVHEIIRGEAFLPDAYITKPFEPHELRSTVKKILKD